MMYCFILTFLVCCFSELEIWQYIYVNLIIDNGRLLIMIGESLEQEMNHMNF